MNFKRPKISKRKIAIFSVFVFIATIFWFLDALKREYNTKIEYPIEFYNFPEELSFNSDYPKKVVLSIKADGFDVISKRKVTNPLRINVKKLAVEDKTDKNKLIINLNKLSDEFFPKSTNIFIKSIKPETITFFAIKVASKKVPVELNISFSILPLYIQSGEIQISPDSVIIFGSNEIISGINKISSIKKDYSNINDSVKDKIQLKEKKNITFSKQFVEIILPIEKYTEKELVIPVNVINSPDSLNLVTFPNEVKLTYKVPLSYFKTIEEKNFIAVVDFLKIKDNNKDKIQVFLSKKPEHIQSIKIFPEYLEYIIEKND